LQILITLEVAACRLAHGGRVRTKKGAEGVTVAWTSGGAGGP
jgi:hypothetical protein